MENKTNSLNPFSFQPTFIPRIPIHPNFDYRSFSNKVGPSIGSFQYCNQVPLNGMLSNSSYGISISSSIPNMFSYSKFDSINPYTIDSMSTIVNDDVISSRRLKVPDSVHWIPNEGGTSDRRQVLENSSGYIKAVLYNEFPCIATDNRNFAPINLPNISTMNQEKELKKSRMIREKWEDEENKKLAELVERHGEKKWSQIARDISGRTGKQCRERWHNHLKPNIKKIEWTEEEDKALVEGLMKYKNKWVQISKGIPGRTENQVKNRWHNIVRSVQPRPESSRKIKQAKCSKILKDYARRCTANEAAASTSKEAEGSTSGISDSYDLATLPNADVGTQDELTLAFAAAFMDEESLEEQMDDESLRKHSEALLAN